MEKIQKYKREIIGVVLIVVIFLGVILLVEPEIISDTKVAYADLKTKKYDLTNLNQEGLRLQNESKELQSEIKFLGEELVQVKKDADYMKQKINPDDLVFHLPSLLIRLENKAEECNLKFEINHSGIKEYNESFEENKTEMSDDGYENEENKENSEDNLESDMVENKEDITTDKAEDKDIENDAEINSVEEDKDNTNIALSKEDTPVLYGLNTTIIPLQVSGEFKSVRNFINYLDKMNYIDNTLINLSSDGKKVNGDILISVFHGSL